MAAAAVDEIESQPISCGHCLEVEGYLLNPKRLPCGHTSCKRCLVDNPENIDSIICRECKKETRLSVEELPSAARGQAFCETCEKKGIHFRTAHTYCVECNRKYCAKHEESHNDAIDHHQVLTVTEFLKSSFAREVRYCPQHKKQVLSLACNQCCTIRCPRCLKLGEDCSKGGKHEFVHAEEVADKVRTEMEPLKAKAEEMFDNIAALVKEVTITISHWDIDTEHGVRLIHSTRDEQLAAITEQYDQVEKKYVASRSSAKEKMTTYLAEQAAVRMDAFLEQLKRLRTSLAEHQPVDLLESNTAIEKKIGQLVDGDFPNLLLTDLKNPEKNGNSNRDPEIGLSTVDDIIFGDKIGNPKVLSGDEQAALMKVGTQVVRGPDWMWGNQDGTPRSVGTITKEMNCAGWVEVRWSNNYTDSYRMKDKYGLKLAYPPAGTTCYTV